MESPQASCYTGRMPRYQRPDGRAARELRPVTITPDFVSSADGSCLMEIGGTRVICTASMIEGVPAWRKDSGLGWVTAEYGMLPGSTGQRKSRPIAKPDSRSVEIQRLIGRAIRSIVHFRRLAGWTIHLDCDVLEADGGTRTASITGAYVALAIAIRRARHRGQLPEAPILRGAIAAVSCGVVKGEVHLDLCYREDASADVDMNFAMTSAGRMVEVQASAEGRPFTGPQLQSMLRAGRKGIRDLLDFQSKAISRSRT